MGACDFTTFVKTNDPMDAAYRSAVQDAQHEYGHNPYNGTISTTNGCHKVVGPVSRKEAWRLVDTYWDWGAQRVNPFGTTRAVKWGPALAIEISEPEHGWLFFGLAAE